MKSMILSMMVVAALALGHVSASPNLLGAQRELAIENAITEEVAHFAVANHPGATLEEGYYDSLEKVISAQKQTVAGSLYTLKLSVGASGCALKGDFDRQRCKVKASSPSRQCTAKVHVQVWMKPQNAVTHWECE